MEVPLAVLFLCFALKTTTGASVEDGCQLAVHHLVVQLPLLL